MKKEIWKDVKGYEGLYQVSNLGKVKSLPKKTHTSKPMLIKTRIEKAGYEVLNIYLEGRMKTVKMHRLVAEAFIPNPDNLPFVNHKDENKQNNCVDNLEWCTAKYNINYGSGHQKVVDKRSRAVIQRALNGEIVCEWKNAMEIKRNLGFDNSAIHKCCKGIKKTYQKFLWEYKK